jgi:hypothetical protein
MKTETLTAFVHGSYYREDGNIDTCYTVEVPIVEKPLWWQERGLSYTSTGYGSRIPTRYMVQFNGKWRRVYCRVYSNNGTLYIGKLNKTGERLIIQQGWK